MLVQPTMDQLYALRLNGMAEAFRRQLEDPGASGLCFEERFALLVESQWTWKESRSLTRRLALAKLKQPACVEDIDFRHPRGLERARWMSLAHESAWVRRKQNVVLICPTGVGKSYLACALAQQACRDGFSALYTRAPQLLRDLQAARAEGGLARRLGKSRSALGRHLHELVCAGVCELETAPNQHRGSVLVARAAYWPYRARQAESPIQPAPEAAAYVEQVRRAFLGPACVQVDFGPADERLAAAWQSRGVPLQTVLLGCVRKSMSMIDLPATPPVRQLHYFKPLLLEVQREPFPTAYWQHLEFNLGRCEYYWQQNAEAAPGPARPRMEQASRATPSAVCPQCSANTKGKTR